jgi:hypothetical protein
VNATEKRLYSEGFRLGWASAAAGHALDEDVARQMVATPRGRGYVQGWTAAMQRLALAAAG